MLTNAIAYLSTHHDQIVQACGALLAICTVLTAIFKPKSTDAYAAMNPRAAAFWKVMATVLPDLVKLSKVLPQLLNGTSDPSKDPAKSDVPADSGATESGK